MGPLMKKDNLKPVLKTVFAILFFAGLFYMAFEWVPISRAQVGDSVTYAISGPYGTKHLKVEIIKMERFSVETRATTASESGGKPLVQTHTSNTFRFLSSSSDRDFLAVIPDVRAKVRAVGSESLKMAGRTFQAEKCEIRYEKGGKSYSGFVWHDPNFPFELIKLEVTGEIKPLTIVLENFKVSAPKN